MIDIKELNERIQQESSFVEMLMLEIGKIIIGQALDADDQPTPQSRRASRLAEAVCQQTSLPVELWDESGSTQAARSAHIAIGGSARRRRQHGHGHLDDLAATFILQTYLDANAQ